MNRVLVDLFGLLALQRFVGSPGEERGGQLPRQIRGSFSTGPDTGGPWSFAFRRGSGTQAYWQLSRDFCQFLVSYNSNS